MKSKNDYNFYNYNTNNHRHIAEIKQELNKHNSDKELKFSFNPHILPNFRGMISTIYCDLNKNINKSDLDSFFRELQIKNPFLKNMTDVFSLIPYRDFKPLDISLKKAPSM